jgi:hypothetical protein
MDGRMPPPPPPEANPWLYYGNILESYLFPDPSQGFRGRLIGLIVLNAVGIMVNLAAYGLFVVRQRQRGVKLWFMRRVTVRDTK